MSSSALEMGDEETSSTDLTAGDTGQAEDSTGGHKQSLSGQGHQWRSAQVLGARERN